MSSNTLIVKDRIIQEPSTILITALYDVLWWDSHSSLLFQVARTLTCITPPPEKKAHTHTQTHTHPHKIDRDRISTYRRTAKLGLSLQLSKIVSTSLPPRDRPDKLNSKVPITAKIEQKCLERTYSSEERGRDEGEASVSIVDTCLSSQQAWMSVAILTSHPSNYKNSR